MIVCTGTDAGAGTDGVNVSAATVIGKDRDPHLETLLNIASIRLNKLI